MEEIRHAVDLLGEDNLVLFHCTSTYPTNHTEINLRVIEAFREEFSCPIGYSGHERGLLPSILSVELGANSVERHITVDRTLWGSDQAASLEPEGLRRMVRDYNFRGYTALHTLKMWKSVNRGEQKNIFPFQEEADCMFNSSIVYELSALKKYALPLLEEITNDNPEYSEARRLISMLQYFDTVEPDWIPNNSLLREFIGGSIYDV